MKNIIYTVLLGALLLSQSAYAGQTPSSNLNGQAEETKNVEVISGTTTTATILPDLNGQLSRAMNPGFRVTGSGGSKTLSLKGEAYTTGGLGPSLFRTSGGTTYLVLTNIGNIDPLAKPDPDSVTNIRTQAVPTPSLNPNAIAYRIIAPPNEQFVQTEYITAGDYWRVHLSQPGTREIYTPIPAEQPYNNTFSGDDEAGDYQAWLTMSFM